MITALVPIKANSVRVPNKNFRPFAGSSLAKIKIEQLLDIGAIDCVMINSDSSEALEGFEKEYGSDLSYVLRPSYYASPKCSASEFFMNLASSAPPGEVMYTPVTSPLVKTSSIEHAIRTYYSANFYDSVVSVCLMKDHMWLDGKPLNYKSTETPNSQDLPDIMKITYGFCLLTKQTVIDYGNVVGGRPYFSLLDEEEAWDIDTELDFELAEYMYKKRNA